MYRIRLGTGMLTIFGEPDNGVDILWSVRNGLVMMAHLEEQFDKGGFLLMPLPSKPDQPTRWKFVLMDETLAPYPVWSRGPERYRDLDGRELLFKNSSRPGTRNLYYHFVTTLLRYVRYEKHGWAEKRMNLPTGKIWATPGPYLRKSMLKQFANVSVDVEIDIMFDEGAFEGKQQQTAQEEKVMAEEILVDGEWPKVAEALEEIAEDEEDEEDEEDNE